MGVQVFKYIRKIISEINYQPILYNDHTLAPYCKIKIHELMSDLNTSAVYPSPEKIRKYVSEFHRSIINNTELTHSFDVQRGEPDHILKQSFPGYEYRPEHYTSENFLVRRKDDDLYPLKLKYIFGNYDRSNVTHIEFYPYYYDDGTPHYHDDDPIKININSTCTEYSFFIDIRDKLKVIAKKDSGLSKEELKNTHNVLDKSYKLYTSTIPSSIHNQEKEKIFNKTESLNLNTTMGQIINFNRTNDITPHYLNNTNISRKSNLIHFNKTTSVNSLIVTDSNLILLSTKDLPTKMDKNHEETGLNTTSSKNLNFTIDQKVLELEHEDSIAYVTNKITSSNRINGITPHLNNTNIYTKSDSIHFNKTTSVNPLIATDSNRTLSSTNDTLRAGPSIVAERTNTPWLIAAGGIISLVIGTFALFKRNQSRNQTQHTQEHIPSSEKRNYEEKHISVQVEDYSLRRSRSSTSLKSRRYTFSSPESIEKLNTEQEPPNCIIVNPDQESCAFITHHSSGV